MPWLRYVYLPAIRPSDNLISGAVALSSSYAAMHPLDTLKTRMQAGAGTGQGAGINVRAIFTKETMQMLSKGFWTSVLGAAGQVR